VLCASSPEVLVKIVSEEMFNWNMYAAMVSVTTEIEMHVIINNVTRSVTVLDRFQRKHLTAT
jgi:hypothetical protein